jgi:ATP-dependent DNA ligase
MVRRDGSPVSAASHSTAMTGRTASWLLSKPPPLQSFLIDGEVVIARDDGMLDFHPLPVRLRPD